MLKSSLQWRLGWSRTGVDRPLLQSYIEVSKSQNTPPKTRKNFSPFLCCPSTLFQFGVKNHGIQGNLMEESHFGPQSHFFQRFLHLSLKYFPKILRVTKHDQCSVDGDITVIVQVCPELWCSQTKGAAKLGLRMNANGSLGDLLTNQVNDQRFHLLPFPIRETLIFVTINISADEMWHNQP